jgi:four helix bundle protein
MSGKFRELRVWQRSKAFAVEVYRSTTGELWDRDFDLRRQIRRSAVSVPSNIAEGDGRRSDKDSCRFFLIANGSLSELSTQLEISMEIGYLSKEAFLAFENEICEIGRELGALIRARRG